MKKKQKMKKRKKKIAIQYEVLKWLFAPLCDSEGSQTKVTHARPFIAQVPKRLTVKLSSYKK